MLLGRTRVALAVGVVCRMARLAALTVLLVAGLAAWPASAATFTVNTTADNVSGICDASHCSLREALLAAAANGTAQPDTIQFNVPGLSGGVASLILSSALPDVPQGVTINGFTQPGALANGIGAPANIAAAMKVEIVANGLATGIRLGQSAVIQGLVIRGAATLVEMVGGGTVRGCYLGTTASGLAAGGGGQVTAILVDSSGDVRTFTIGGSTAADRNVIAGPGTATSVGIDIVGTPRLTVEGNLIGVASNASTVLGHGRAGVRYQSLSTLATTDITVTGNVIGGASGPDGAGIRIEPCTSGVCSPGQVFDVFKNYIGTNGSLVAVPNRRGIFVGDPVSVIASIGRVLNQNGNTISGNLGAGVAVAPGSQDFSANVRVEGNSIANNGGLGIDLFDDGVVTADAGTRRLGQQNLPVITGIARGPLTTTVAGTVTGIPNQFVRVDAYRSTAVDPTGYGEGEVYVGSTSTSFDPTGQATFVITVPFVVPVAEAITATSTTFVTSEFSRVTANLGITLTPGTTLETFQSTNQTVRVTNPTTSSGPAAPVVFRVNLIDGGPDKISCSPGVTTAIMGSVLTFTAPQVPPGATVQCEYSVSFTTRGARTVSAQIVQSGTFDPEAQNDVATSVLDVNRERLISLGGRVTVSPGNPTLPTVAVTLSGPVTSTSTLDQNGRFDFRNVPAGTYTVTASATNWQFSAPYQLFNQVDPRGNLDFTAKAVFSVIGRAIDQSGAPLSNIDLYLSGSGSGQKTTGADGRYEFGPLDYTGVYTITPSSNDSGASFRPRSAQFTARVGPQFFNFVLAPNQTSLVVNTVSDVGDGVCDAAHCSLRDALMVARANDGVVVTYDEIRFAIPGSGVRTIVLTSPLPVASWVDIRGYSQPGSSPNTQASGPIDAVPLIEIDGNGLPVALVLENSLVEGLIVNRAETLVRIAGSAGVAGSFLGTTADGTRSAGGNQRTAIRIDNTGEEAGIGGRDSGRNVIAGDGGVGDVGIDIYDEAELFVDGNLIGLAKDGVTVLGHGAAGIRYRPSTPELGRLVRLGEAAGVGNVIAGATDPDGAGIRILACPVACVGTERVDIGNNLIGTTADGRAAAPNTYGIRVDDPTGGVVSIGMDGVSKAPNVIRFNARAGILIAPPTTAASSRVLIGPNRISDNGGLGIDVDGDGPTPNDPGDADPGRQNWPRITDVSRDESSTTIEGVASGDPGAALTVHFFANTTGDPSGSGEGERWIGSHPVVLDGNGTAAFTVTRPLEVALSEAVSAFAVGTTTSEFSPAEVVMRAGGDGPDTGSTFQVLRYEVQLGVATVSPSWAVNPLIRVEAVTQAEIRGAACPNTAATLVPVLPNLIELRVPQLNPGTSLVCTVDVVFRTAGSKQIRISGASDTPSVFLMPTAVLPVSVADTPITLSGRVTEAGSAPSVPVTVTVSGTITRSLPVAADGSYGVANVPAGTYTIAPQAAGRAFAPATRTLVDQAVSRSDLDFAMSEPLAITGRITERDGGAAVPGVTVTLSGERDATVVSDASGNYAFGALPRGTYTLTVSQDGRRFDPPSRTLAALTGDAVADFVRLPLYTISGTITDLNGSPVPGVTVGLSGGRTETATTDAAGFYAFGNLPSTSFVVTPTRPGFTFSPVPRSISVLEANEDVSFVVQSGAFARYLAEGSTGALFDTQIALFNATGTPATATLTFQKPDGSTLVETVPLDGVQRRTVIPESLPGLENTAFSTVVASDQPIAVDRTMTWDDARYGSHAETGIVQPLTRWFLAEGATTAGFELFYLVQNANPTPANVQVRYLLTSGAPITKAYVVPANSRFNIWVNLEDALLADAEVSADVTSDLPIIVERAMYRTVNGQTFGMGHEGAGVPQASMQWYFAEGATGPFFDLFFLIANPTDDVAQVEATYLKPDGSTVVKVYTVAPNSRFNIWVDFEDPALASTAVGTTFRATNGVAVVVERAMWWAGDVSRWVEGHNTAGATRTGEKWALAEGEVSGAPFFTDTFILVANTGPTAGTVRVTLVFEDGTAPLSRDLPIPASARLNVMVSAEFPEAVGKRFGTIVESVGPTRLPLVVERAMYNSSGGVDFAAGTAALGARLR